jgi:predicted dehydrogenase/threonine dehydrogenase-like Zn-dependent dehydrogenase
VSVKQTLNRRATQLLMQLGYEDARASDAKREAWWWLSARSMGVRRAVKLVHAKQVVWTGQGRVELLDVVIPAAGGDEVTVRAVATIVSPGTERAQFLMLPNTSAKPPFRPGYTGAGIVESVGRRVRGISPGDRVAVRGMPHASRATVPMAGVHAIPEGVAAADAAFVQLGVICHQAVRRAKLKGGERVCVVGSGLIGLLTQRLSVVAGAGETIVVARSRRREAMALAGGADRFLATGEGAETAGLEADVVFEASGDAAALSTAVAAVRDGGTVILVGSPRGVTVDVPVADIVRRRVRLVGAHVETLTWEGRVSGVDLQREAAERFLEDLASGGLRVDDLASVVADPREPELVYRELARGADVSAVRFDWPVLDEPDRQAAVFPTIGARGVVSTRPLPAPGESGDPFAGAEGRLRIGLLGCGDIAVHNALAMSIAPNVELVATFDPSATLAEDVAARFGASAEASSDALLERSDVDAVFICAPHHLHLPLAEQAAAAGKHLIVEKPLANDLESAERIVAAADAAGVVLSVCFPQRYDRHVQEAKRLVESGAIGPVAGTFVKLLMDKPPSYWVGGFSGRAVSTWRASRAQAGGGVLIMNLSHYIDLVRYVTGAEVEVVSAAASAADRAAEVEDTIGVTLAYEGGGVGTILGCASLPGLADSETDVQVWGRDGRIVLEPYGAAMSLRALPGRRARRWYDLPRDAVDIRAVYLSRLATAIHRGEDPDITAGDALAVQRVIEAAYSSARSGGPARTADLVAGR